MRRRNERTCPLRTKGKTELKLDVLIPADPFILTIIPAVVYRAKKDDII